MKKIFSIKSFLVLIIFAIFSFTFIKFNDNAIAEESYDTYINYYFFSDIFGVQYYNDNLASGQSKTHESTYANIIPEGAEKVSQGLVTLSRTGNSMDTNTWSLTNFWDYFKTTTANGDSNRVYTVGNISYVAHSSWNESGSTDDKLAISVRGIPTEDLVKASLLTNTNVNFPFVTVDNGQEKVTVEVTRTYGSGDDIDGHYQISDSKEDEYLIPALYYIEYKIPKEEKYKITTYFKDNGTKEEIKQKEETDRIYSTGDKETINCPNSIPTSKGDYKLVSSPFVNVTITDKDEIAECLYELEATEPKFKVTTYFKDKETGKEIANKEESERKYKNGDTEVITCKSSIGEYELASTQKNNVKFTNQDEIVNCLYQKIEQTQTSDILIWVVWFIGISSLGYGFYYYRKNLVNKK